MSKVYIPAQSPDDWQRFLADPGKQWKKGYSARATAYAWHAVKGFPPEITALFHDSCIEEFKDLEVLQVIPEHKVYLPPTRGLPSQNDVFVLAKTKAGALMSVTVEAKVSERFGKAVGEWNRDGSAGKRERLDFLRPKLGLETHDLEEIRYQLLHRLASAILEAERFNAEYAVMVVQSFSPTDEGFEDYSRFLALFGAEPVIGTLYPLGDLSDVQVYSGWARGDAKFLEA